MARGGTTYVKLFPTKETDDLGQTVFITDTEERRRRFSERDEDHASIDYAHPVFVPRTVWQNYQKAQNTMRCFHHWLTRV